MQITFDQLTRAMTRAVEAHGAYLNKTYMAADEVSYRDEHTGRTGTLAIRDGGPVAEGDLFAEIDLAQAIAASAAIEQEKLDQENEARKRAAAESAQAVKESEEQE